MEFEFTKQAHQGMITEMDEIVIFNSDEPMQNGRFVIARLEQNGCAMLVGIGSNEGTISQIYFEVGE